jgi:hypothetical protein
MTHDDRNPIATRLDELRSMAAAVAEELKAAAAGSENAPIPGTGGGSRHRGLPEDLRDRFIDVRAALFQRGIYDPVLVRFDTASVAQASTLELAERLEQVAATL